MGNVIHHVMHQSSLPDGGSILGGRLNLSTSYAHDGDALNLANYLKSSSNVILLVSSDATADNKGYLVTGTAGSNCEVARVKAFVAGAGAEDCFYEANAAADLSGLNVPFIAYGLTY